MDEEGLEFQLLTGRYCGNNIFIYTYFHQQLLYFPFIRIPSFFGLSFLNNPDYRLIRTPSPQLIRIIEGFAVF
jgi:hypothetical protein